MLKIGYVGELRVFIPEHEFLGIRNYLSSYEEEATTKENPEFNPNLLIDLNFENSDAESINVHLFPANPKDTIPMACAITSITEGFSEIVSYAYVLGKIDCGEIIEPVYNPRHKLGHLCNSSNTEKVIPEDELKKLDIF